MNFKFWKWRKKNSKKKAELQEKPGMITGAKNEKQEGDFTTSFIVANATDNAALGYIIGGNITGAVIGEMLKDNSSDDKSQDSTTDDETSDNESHQDDSPNEQSSNEPSNDDSSNSGGLDDSTSNNFDPPVGDTGSW
jgi:hypothetical protein